MKKIVIPPTSELYPWALASAVISAQPPNKARNEAEYMLEMAAMNYDDAQRKKRRRKKVTR
ncbi:MAG: hypothetical protein JNJ45_05390 [Chthonomonas sp.]|nr:hypothetical protein [Chthonomonas sp.]